MRRGTEERWGAARAAQPPANSFIHSSLEVLES